MIFAAGVSDVTGFQGFEGLPVGFKPTWKQVFACRSVSPTFLAVASNIDLCLFCWF